LQYNKFTHVSPPSSTVPITQVTQFVRTLHLRDFWSLYCEERFDMTGVGFRLVSITTDVFPALQTLILDTAVEKTCITLNTKCTPQLNLPNLKELITMNTKLDDATLIKFIGLFKDSLRTVTSQDV
ncbi:hypothetical protein A1F96_09307, partial [Pyrenophora tritici-repentis]